MKFQLLALFLAVVLIEEVSSRSQSELRKQFELQKQLKKFISGEAISPEGNFLS